MFLYVLFEYIYWSWLFFSYYTYQPNSQIWVDLRNKRQQGIHCFLSEKSKFHGINQLRRQCLYPKNYKHLNLAQLLDLCCSVLQLVRLDCGSIVVVQHRASQKNDFAGRFVDILCVQQRGNTKANLKPSRTSAMLLFVKIVNCFQPLTIFAKQLHVDLQLGNKYTSVISRITQSH